MSYGEMKTPVKGKVALVTGANRGIGKAIAESLLAAGASKVYLAVRSPASTDGMLEAFGDRVVPLKVDLTNDAAVAGLADQARDVDIVINNGGVLEIASALSGKAPESLAKEFDVNVYGLLRVARAFEPILTEKRGALVQLNSIVSVLSFPDFATYSASKAAAYSLTQAIAKEWSEKGVQVVSVHPGPIATDMGERAGLLEGASEPVVVAESIIQALEQGTFHVFPDPIAQQIYDGYESYAKAVIEA